MDNDEHEPPRIEREGYFPNAQRKHAAFIQWLLERGDPFSRHLAETTPEFPMGPGSFDPPVLSDAERTEASALAAAAAPSIKDELRLASETLKDTLARFDPIDVIACITLAETFAPWGSYYEPAEERSEVVVEIIVGLCTTLAHDEVGSEQPTRDDLRELKGRVGELRNLVFLYNTACQITGEMSGIKGTTIAYWTNVRGTARRAHAYQIAEHVYTAAGRHFEATYGFSIVQYLHLIDTIEELLEDRVTTFFASGEVHRRDAGLVDDIRRLLEMGAEDLAGISGLPAEVVRTILDRLSLTIPSHAPGRYSGPFDQCPLSTHPFVTAPGSDRYLLPIFGIAGREFISVFDPELMRARGEAYSMARAAASDDYAVALVAGVLPGSESATHLRYEMSDGTAVGHFEVDGLIEYEGFLIIVEGKANNISVPAQRGDIERAATHAEEVVGKAWEQASRVKSLVTERDSTAFLDESGGIVKTVGRYRPDRVLMLNPTLYSLGLLSLIVPTLQEVHDFTAGRELWSISLADLQVAVEVLSDPALFIHYFQWRVSLPIGETMFVFDETDILASYLHGYVGKEPKDPCTHVFVTPSTSSLDDYFAFLDGDGPPAPKPRRRMGSAIDKRLRELARERPKSWLIQSLALLDLSIAGARDLDQMLVSAENERLEKGDFLLGDADGVAVVIISEQDTAEGTYLRYRQEIVGARAYVVVQVRRGASRIIWSARL